MTRNELDILIIREALEAAVKSATPGSSRAWMAEDAQSALTRLLARIPEATRP